MTFPRSWSRSSSRRWRFLEVGRAPRRGDGVSSKLVPLLVEETAFPRSWSRSSSRRWRFLKVGRAPRRGDGVSSKLVAFLVEEMTFPRKSCHPIELVRGRIPRSVTRRLGAIQSVHFGQPIELGAA